MNKSNFTRKKLIVAGMALLVFAACITAYYLNTNGKLEYVFETVKVKKGTVSNVVTATGTLEATNTVIVGTQVSGVIEKIHVDFNSPVKKGQLLATLDKSTLQFALENAEAEVNNAQAEYSYQKVTFNRMKSMYDKDLLSASDYDLAHYKLKKSEAALKSAKANLKKSSQNVSYATIYSPIDGVVLNRAVEEGQTVAASMNTPELFTITNDLSEMQVEANVDEADIGMVKEGQRVEFTVDAFPDKTYSGLVTEVRLQPKETSHVITYTSIVSTKNPDKELKPGMTANIVVYVQEASDVLVLAGKAIGVSLDRSLLRQYRESLDDNEKPFRNKNVTGNKIKRQRTEEDKSEQDKKVTLLWVKENEIIKPVKVETGVTDGFIIEIISGLREGDEVVTSMGISAKKKNNTSKNSSQKSPFVPQRRGRGGPPKG